MTTNMDQLIPTNNHSEPTVPFVVRNLRLGTGRGDDFTPSARVEATQALRTSGLLRELPAEEAKSLLMLLTYVTANGWTRPSLEQLGEAFGVHRSKVMRRMERLEALSFGGMPLVIRLEAGDGLVSWTPSRSVAVQEHDEAPSPVEQTEPHISHRDEIIANSRALYAKPRAEVEREMAIRMGWPLPEHLEAEADAARQAAEAEAASADPKALEARSGLLIAGVMKEQADRLIAEYGIDQILKQLVWLPYRHAKNPARLIVAAVEDDYEEPLALQRRRAPAEAPHAIVEGTPDQTGDTAERPNGIL